MSGYADKNGKEKPAAKRSKVGEGYDAPFRGYVNLSLTPAQKETYQKWADSASFWDVFESSVADGVNLSLKLDTKSNGFLASATQRRVSSVNAGLVVTARGGTAVLALGRLLFCLTILSKGRSWEEIQPVTDPDRW